MGGQKLLKIVGHHLCTFPYLSISKFTINIESTLKSNKHEIFLIIFEKICLLISDKSALDTFLCNKYEKDSTSTPLSKPPRLFDFGHFSYLHVIKTPRLSEPLE